MTPSAPLGLDDEAALEAACGRDVALIYKHSSRCGVSLAAAAEVREFAEARQDVPVYVVDVVRDRALSREIERRLGVRHESPQVILLRNGEPVWDASHRRVTARELADALDRGGPPGRAGR
jgi:bacillithiol system protein YtxJ